MNKQATRIIEICEQTLQTAKLDPDGKGAALQRAHSSLTSIGADSLTKEEQQRLDDLRVSAFGLLSSLERHGATGAAMGALEALRRRGELV